jgi:hypothetical protein
MNKKYQKIKLQQYQKHIMGIKTILKLQFL